MYKVTGYMHRIKITLWMYVTDITPVTKCFKYTCSLDSYTHTCRYINVFVYVCNWVWEEKIGHLDKLSNSLHLKTC